MNSEKSERTCSSFTMCSSVARSTYTRVLFFVLLTGLTLTIVKTQLRATIIVLTSVQHCTPHTHIQLSCQSLLKLTKYCPR